MNLENWKDEGKLFIDNDLEVFYRQSEISDEVLLCLHGFPTSSFDYHKIYPALSKKFAILTFDMIGYGFSSKPVAFDYTTFNQVTILQNLLNFLKIRKVHLLTHDYGNTISQELLARQAENRLNFSIETICFLNGALFPETHRPILTQKILISPIGFLFAKLILDSAFKKSLASVFGKNTQPTVAELEDFVKVFKYNNGKRIAHKLIRYMTERQKYRERWVKPLQQMKQKFCFINGLADKVSGKHLVERFRQVVPQQTDILELEDIGHFPHFEVPQIVLEKYFNFRGNN